jgi:disulfide bond formation protein DsbB
LRGPGPAVKVLLNVRTPLLTAWFLALLATLGSLFFSEVMKLPPCVLCWYQRISMYPLVVLLAVGWLRADPKVTTYAGPLAAIGWGIAVYHNLLYYHLIPESITPCTEGVSCTSRQIEWLGFITIPLLSLMAFTIVGLFLFLDHRSQLRKEST